MHIERRLLVLLTALCLLINLHTWGQGSRLSKAPPAAPAELFDQYVRRALLLWKTPGISVVVVKDDQLQFLKGYGVTEAGKPAPFTPHTLAICASTTKAMTAVCMAMLVDEGKAKWTDKVKDLLPDFRLYDPYVTAELTVQDLFTHNAGLDNADGLWVFGYSRDEILNRMRLLKPVYPYHSSFIYQNLMYLVAGEVIHHVSGMTWEDFVTSRLFRQLGMDHTYAAFELSSREMSHETPHFLIRDSIMKIRNLTYPSIGPAGGVWSCAEDMGKWIQFLLDSGYTAGRKRLLSPASYRALFKPLTLLPLSQFYPTAELTRPNWMTYALGWFQQDYKGKMIQFHTGSLDGATAIIGLVLEDHFGIYIFGNLDHSEIRHALMFKAIDLWCGTNAATDWSRNFYTLYEHIRDSARKVRDAKDAGLVKQTNMSLPIEAYTGKYANEIYGPAEVIRKGDSLEMKLPNDITMELSHRAFDSFNGIYNYFWWDNTLVKFSLDTEGRVTQFNMDDKVYTLQSR
jgi:CubicO group peptidase (beta-lactamase class C family)